ncbi:hypothetical protein HMPREF0973_00887 [Prevotella veroralis F0319]|uniref:Uncharacterized protein n=1 Tax=Prevotella veroralis F0319 TaxID=649761 RepID=C9MMQ4_9BACT|nr:hypothetical protein HMPREF0973_00887 [Prevotella veroralis F0319]
MRRAFLHIEESLSSMARKALFLFSLLLSFTLIGFSFDRTEYL